MNNAAWPTKSFTVNSKRINKVVNTYQRIKSKVELKFQKRKKKNFTKLYTLQYSLHNNRNCSLQIILSVSWHFCLYNTITVKVVLQAVRYTG